MEWKCYIGISTLVSLWKPNQIKVLSRCPHTLCWADIVLDFPLGTIFTCVGVAAAAGLIDFDTTNAIWATRRWPLAYTNASLILIGKGKWLMSPWWDLSCRKDCKSILLMIQWFFLLLRGLKTRKQTMHISFNVSVNKNVIWKQHQIL